MCSRGRPGPSHTGSRTLVHEPSDDEGTDDEGAGVACAGVAGAGTAQRFSEAAAVAAIPRMILFLGMIVFRMAASRSENRNPNTAADDLYEVRRSPRAWPEFSFSG